jgi:hypothetical protein
MDSIAYFGALFGLVAWLWCFTLGAEVKRLKRTIEDAGIGGNETASLRDILSKSIGRTADIRVEQGQMSSYTVLKDCQIIEVDEEWVALLVGKKAEQRVVRLRGIRSVNIRKEQI